MEQPSLLRRGRRVGDMEVNEMNEMNEMNENLHYEAAFRKVEQAGQVVNFMDYSAAFAAAVACKYSRRSRCHLKANRAPLRPAALCAGAGTFVHQH